MEWLTNLLSGIGGGISAVVTGWQARQTARVEADVATIRARAEADAQIAVAQATVAARMAEQAQASEAAWDLAMGSQMERTWKDEWYVLLFSVPLILAFLGEWGAGVTRAGFAALDGMPAWYYYSVGTMIAATFGMRRLLALFESVRGTRR